jgi:hypothetical protein
MLASLAVLVRGIGAIGVGVLAFALSSAPAIAQTPTPDPAPVPAPAPPPSEPAVEPEPEPEPEPVVEPAATAPTKETRPVERTRPKKPLALRMDRLHPPLAKKAHYTEPRSAKQARLAEVSTVNFTGSESSDSLSVGLFVLLALGGVLGAGLLLLFAVPDEFLGAVPLQLVDHRGELAFGGFAVLIALVVGLAIPLLLQ